MKKKSSILLLSALAIFIVIAVEGFFVYHIYHLETEKFDFRYRGILQKGLDYLNKKEENPGLGGVFYLMEFPAKTALEYFHDNDPDTVKFKENVLAALHKTLTEKQKVDGSLKSYLKKMKIESEFNSIFRITHLVLLGDDLDIPIYNSKKDSTWIYPDTLGIKKNQIPVNHYSFIGDHYEIGIDYYVDFDHKKAEVFRAVTASLIIAVLALLIVCLIFLLSVRNLMEERRLSQLKTDFINNMTHELKTPLSTISVATRTLENETILSDREKSREIVTVIRRQNRQLTKQINHLLEISMWERKQFSLDRRILELEPFFTGIAESFRWECQERKCSLEEKYCLVNKTAWLDEVQITVALHNLLINAIKYCTQEPLVILEVSCEDRLIISVTDNGIGISKEDQKRIFDKFYRVSTGNVHKVKGLGLGLFYVKQIVEAHGGTVEVTSRIGKGSTFTINMPAHGKNKNTVS
ncbi:MAG: HAMP domain-containing sensor histidine kinase [Bacteroidales bacterium]|nr:HAMP domain-containing sensor histidine kinase [Bacteroidales bacterium]